MKESRKKLIEELILSKGGLHLSLYFQKGMTHFQVKKQLHISIQKTLSELRGKMPDARIQKFLSPLWALYNDENLLKRMKCSFAVFRNENSFEIIKVPIKFDSFWSLANTFYVKPLLKWIQSESEFLLVGVNQNQAKIYFGDMSEAFLIDDVKFSQPNQNDNLFKREFAFWLNEWIINLNQNGHFNIVLVCDLDWAIDMKSRLRNGYKKVINLKMDFNPKYINTYVDEIRKNLVTNSHLQMLTRLGDFYDLNYNQFISKDLFEIAEAVSLRKVKKLLVSEDYKIFGSFDLVEGKLNLHSRDLNHEDDDLLDDLAQEVLKYGGEVMVVNKDDYNIDLPAIAVIEDKGFEYLIG